MHLAGREFAIIGVQVREILGPDSWEAAQHRSDLLRTEHTSIGRSRRQLGTTDHRAPTAARQVGNPGVHQQPVARATGCERTEPSLVRSSGTQAVPLFITACQVLRQQLPQHLDRRIVSLRQYQKAALAHFFFFF
jgi:hypothetical protein